MNFQKPGGALRFGVLSVLLGGSLLVSGSRAFAAPFTAGNLVVYRVGATGNATALSSAATPVFLDEYSPTGTLVQSIALPTAATASGNRALTASGSAGSEGLISRSADGNYILLTGYNADAGTVAVTGTATTAVVRVIGRAAADGTVDTSTTTTSFSANSIRSATSADGTNIYAVGANTGVILQPLGGSGAGTLISNTQMNLRQANIFGGQLYVSSGSGTNTFKGVNTVGTGLPTTTGQTTARLPGLADTTNPNNYGFFFADLTPTVPGLDTLYIADSANGVQKFSLVNGSYVLNNNIALASATGLTGTTNADGSVTLYVTTTTAAGTLRTLTDTAGFNANDNGTLATVATAGANTAFRGIAFAPSAGATLPNVSVAVSPSSVLEDGTTNLVYTFTRTATTGALTVNFSVGGTATSGADYTQIGAATFTATTGTVTFADGAATATVTLDPTADTTFEPDETAILTLTPGTGYGVASPGAATGTITNDDAASITSGVLISELRLSGPGGASDEFIELANITGTDLSLSGLTLQAGGVAIPGLDLTGKTIPAGGHLLVTNSTGYSLGAYAAGDASYTGDIPTATPISLMSGSTTLDAVGGFSGSAPAGETDQYAYVRRLESGVPLDTGSDSNDFNLVDTSSTQSTVDQTGAGPLAGARLGAPGPQSVLSPIQRNASVSTTPLNIPGSGLAPDAKYASVGTALDPKGRLSLRRTLTNNGTFTATRLRLRIVAITAGTNASPADGSGTADVRALSGSTLGVRYRDSGGNILTGAMPLALEAPSSPTSPVAGGSAATPPAGANGGGLNSSWSVVNFPSGGLAPRASINVEFLLGIVKDGKYRVVVDTELLP